MSFETIEVPAPHRGNAADSQPDPGQRAGMTRPEVSLVRPETAAQRGLEARLAAELAQQRHVTVELQHAILPLHDEPFDLPGLRAVVRYLPASHDSRVGGDWYITAELPDSRVLLAIGDVGGHGLEAAAG